MNHPPKKLPAPRHPGASAAAGNPDDELRVRPEALGRVGEVPDLPDVHLRVPERPKTARRSSSSPTACARQRADRRARAHLLAPEQSRSRDPRGSARACGTTPSRAWCSRSGMAAISTTMLSFLRPGDVILCSEPVYGGTEFLIENILPQFGIQRVWFGSGHHRRPRSKRPSRRARALGRIGMIFLETPANPTNGLVDIAALRRDRAPRWPTSKGQPSARGRRQHVPRPAVAAPAAARRGPRASTR